MGKHFNSSIKLYFNNEVSLNILSKEYNIARSTIFKNNIHKFIYKYL